MHTLLPPTPDSLSARSLCWQVHAFDLTTLQWSALRLDVPLMRSFQSLTGASDNSVFGFAGYVVFQSPSVAFVYNDLLVLQPGKSYWQKFMHPADQLAPGVRYDHRVVTARNGTTLVLYGGSYQSVDDIGADVWAFDTTKILPSQLVRAPPEGRRPCQTGGALSSRGQASHT